MRKSAGLVMYRLLRNRVEFLLVHPGGPFWRNKDDGAWTIPKGEIEGSEAGLATARREFEEELGTKPAGPFIELAPVRQKSGKIIHAWAFEGDLDPLEVCSNVFSLEWPPRSGRLQEFPEIDRAAWFDLQTAKSKINPAQIALLEEAQQKADKKQ